MRNKPTVTVAMPAYNEEKGIKKLIESVLDQNQLNFTLKEIIVIADAPTDNTVDIVEGINSELIKLVNDGMRKGQLQRINEIYKTFDSDILVQTDADVIFGHKDVLCEIVNSFNKDANIMMVGGNALAEKPMSFVSKAIFTTLSAYNRIAFTLNLGNNINTVHGCIIAFKKGFVSGFVVPVDAVVNDVYMYYTCIQKGFKYQFAKNATVYYKLPTNVKSHIAQNTRYLSTSGAVDKYFPKELVEKECYIPKNLLLQTRLKEFIIHPVQCLFIYIINKYCAYKAKKSLNLKPTWELDTSSRK